jgi:uncharacterized phiE125 gp8 family phage protein
MLCKIISAPTVESVSLDEVYNHTSTDSDHADYLTPLISRARKRFEQRTGRLLVQQTWQFALPKFGNAIELPYAPLQSIISIKYIDNQGQLVTVDPAEYRVVDHGIKATLTPKLGGCWPAPGYKVADAVQVECVLGHAPVVTNAIDIANIIDPDKYNLAKQAILILVADWFRNREDTAPVQLYAVPNAFKAICDELAVELL